MLYGRLWTSQVDNAKVTFCVVQKITTKNAFGLHLIDYMADILKQKDSELTNFKVLHFYQSYS